MLHYLRMLSPLPVHNDGVKQWRHKDPSNVKACPPLGYQECWYHLVGLFQCSRTLILRVFWLSCDKDIISMTNDPDMLILTNFPPSIIDPIPLKKLLQSFLQF